MTETEQLLDRVAAAARKPEQGDGSSFPAPADRADVARAETVLGFALPPLLAGLYTGIADGGFGPEYGLLPLHSAVERYLANRASGRTDPDWPWPEGVLPISDWGCAMLACVDCRSEKSTVLLYEPNADEADHAWYVDAPSLAEWLRTWLDGTAWYCDVDGPDVDMDPWVEFHARTFQTSRI